MKPELKYGLLSGLGVCLWILAEYFLGLRAAPSGIGQYAGFVSNLIPLLAVWLLLKKKQAELGPFFSVWRGVLAGLSMSLAASLVIYCFQVYYNHSLNPGWQEQALGVKVAQLRSLHVAETDIREQIVHFRRENDALPMLLSVVLSSTLLGGLPACLISPWLIWRAGKAR